MAEVDPAMAPAVREVRAAGSQLGACSRDLPESHHPGEETHLWLWPACCPADGRAWQGLSMETLLRCCGRNPFNLSVASGADLNALFPSSLGRALRNLMKKTKHFLLSLNTRLLGFPSTPGPPQRCMLRTCGMNRS